MLLSKYIRVEQGGVVENARGGAEEGLWEQVTCTAEPEGQGVSLQGHFRQREQQEPSGRGGTKQSVQGAGKRAVGSEGSEIKGLSDELTEAQKQQGP